MPKISIITPVYCDTSEKVEWLNETIQSVVSQSVADWEMILIDDKSSVLIDAAKLKWANDSRIRWLENATNEGPARTRNTAVALAKSDCILPLDSDDMLADNEALEIMYDAWIMDKTKTVYGNVQLYRLSQNGFERSKVYQLASYSFEGAMNLQFGIMPVTTMHSKEAHYAAGGWKAFLAHGREDLEYWIACGKAGFCGLKINHATLLYRKHEQSRDYKLKFENQELRNMQIKIKDLHSDVYNGRFPVACCGKGKASGASSSKVDPVVLSGQHQNVTKITELDGYDEKDLEWVSYQGGKRGSFSVMVRGPNTLPSDYLILGTGHTFQIHKRHHDFFAQRQRLGFRINQLDPRQQMETVAEEPRIEEVMPQVIEVPRPELSTLVRLDNTSQAREVIIEPNPPQSYSDVMPAQLPTDFFKARQDSIHSLSSLNLSDKITTMLIHDHWTVESLAKCEPGDLTKYDGIGAKREETIISKAKELIKNQ